MTPIYFLRHIRSCILISALWIPSHDCLLTSYPQYATLQKRKGGNIHVLLFSHPRIPFMVDEGDELSDRHTSTSILTPTPQRTQPTANKSKKQLPLSELINRRKSPALWRYDLSNEEESSSSFHSTRNHSLNNLSRPPEIMAPVGGFPQLHAAIANGADSIYVGLTTFSARARATNFSPDELTQVVSIAHAAHVKVYVAFNTLIFDSEFQQVEDLLSHCVQVGVDAIIVQDIGIAAAIARWNQQQKHPSQTLPIHASTQQSITNTDGVIFANKYGGASRVVLGRELSIIEIQQITQELHEKQNLSLLDQDNKNNINKVEVEVFVHGALCVSYSGQCFSSEFIGGRSANRGQCAQACRLPYGLIQDGQLVDMKDVQYLLSPQDLCGLDQVEALVRAGVHCLKIEGRLKDELYVAATTRAYRKAVDTAWATMIQEQNQHQEEEKEMVTNSRRTPFTTIPSITPRRILDSPNETIHKSDLAQIFSRGQDEYHDGLSSGFFQGTQHQELVIGRSPRHRGVHVGRVGEGTSWKRGLVIDLDTTMTNPVDGNAKLLPPLKLGDGLVIDRGMPQKDELGGQIYQIESIENDRILVRFSREVEKSWKIEDEKHTTIMKNPKRIASSLNTSLSMAPIGAHVWKTNDAEVDKKLKRLATGIAPKSPVQVLVSGKVHHPLTITIHDLNTGKSGSASSEHVLVSAENRGIDEITIRKAVGTLGNTKFIIDEVHGIDVSNLSSDVWCPVSWIKEVRRQALEALESQILPQQHLSSTSHLPVSIQPIITLENVSKNMSPRLQGIQKKNIDAQSSPKLSILARNIDQVNILCDMLMEGESIHEIIIDFLEVEGMKEAVTRVRNTNARVVIASPRIIKPGEAGIWRTLLRLEPDGLLIRSAGLLNRLLELSRDGVIIPDLIGDFSLNVVNVLSAQEMLHVGRLQRITAAYDLSANAITELAQAMGDKATMLEVIAHAHLPIFHTEHCVFARFLSKGNSYLDCGHACQRHTVHLRDQSGGDNLVLADMGCRNTVFSAEAQSGLYSVLEWIDAGVGTLRVELVDENSEDVGKIVKAYMGVISGRSRVSDAWEMLKEVRDSNGRYMSVGVGSLRNVIERQAGAL